MSRDQQNAVRALRQARMAFLIAKLRYLAAVKEVERHVHRTDLPALLRKQI